jgi:hypothetical protein
MGQINTHEHFTPEDDYNKDMNVLSAKYDILVAKINNDHEENIRELNKYRNKAVSDAQQKFKEKQTTQLTSQLNNNELSSNYIPIPQALRAT